MAHCDICRNKESELYRIDGQKLCFSCVTSYLQDYKTKYGYVLNGKMYKSAIDCISELKTVV